MELVNKNNIGDFYNAVNIFITDLNKTNDVSKQLDEMFNASNDAEINMLNQEIITTFNNVNSNKTDVFYKSLSTFMTDLNNTNNISKELNSIFNASNDAEINMLNQEIITTFNNVNSNKTDVFYKSLNAFITDLNNTNNISKELNNIFNTANDAKLKDLDDKIITSFNNVNSGKIDVFYKSLSTFITDLNNTNNISKQLNSIFNTANDAKLKDLDDKIITLFNNNIQKSTKWLEHYYAMEIELKRAMKPDPMIAYRLGKVATFLPNIGIGDVKNKMGDVMKQMKPDFSIPNFPSVSGMLPPQDYSNLDFDVYLDGDDNDKKYHILSEGKPIKTV